MLRGFGHFDNIHIRQGLAQQPEHRELETEVLHLTASSTRIGSLELWQSVAQCIQHGAVELRPATEDTDGTAPWRTVSAAHELAGISILSGDFRSERY